MDYKLNCLEKHLYVNEITILLEKENYFLNIKEYMSNYEFFDYLAEYNEFKLTDINKKTRLPKIKIIWDKYIFISNINDLLKISRKDLDLKKLYLDSNLKEKKLLILYIDYSRNNFIKDFLNVLIKKNRIITKKNIVNYIDEILPKKNISKKTLKSINNYNLKKKNDLVYYLITYFCFVGLLTETQENKFIVLRNIMLENNLSSSLYDFFSWFEPNFLKKFN